MKIGRLLLLIPLAIAVLLAIFLAPKFVTAPAHSGTELDTKYISGQGWPPKITTSAGSFTCKEGGSEIEPGGITSKKVINGRVYCVTTQSEGAAGSIYTTYKYVTTNNGRLTTAEFTLRYPQCLNYSDPQKTECLTERQNFDLDGLVDRIVMSVK